MIYSSGFRNSSDTWKYKLTDRNLEDGILVRSMVLLSALSSASEVIRGMRAGRGGHDPSES
jgi:hypothetical protein